MCTIDRVRLITPDGHAHVRDYAFSQVCELTMGLCARDRDTFWEGQQSVITERDSHFAPAGTSLKYVGPV